MKKRISKIAMLVFILVIAACDNRSEPPLEESIFDTETPELSELDIWIRENITIPYNIEVIYKWEDYESDQGRYLYPPKEEFVRTFLEALIRVWINPYSDLGGENFIKNASPRQIVLIGGFNYDPNGNNVLGLADAGMKITMFRVNETDYSNKPRIRAFMSTTHHEYTHVLNQTIPFSDQFQTISAGNYDADWTGFTDKESLELGFITKYARSSPTEDFAEMVARLVMRRAEYDQLLASIDNPEARNAILAKENLVALYFENEWGINIYELQELNERRLAEL